MSLQPMIAGLAASLVLSAGGMAYGAASGSRSLTAVAALAYALAVLIVAWRVNRGAWIADGTAPQGLLFHTVYGWGAAAFFAVYGLSTVRWQHGFQYGSAAALIAAGFLYYVHRMGSDGNETAPAPRLTILHGLAVTAGLIFLLTSGKLQSMKGDWPANYIFLFGGLALVGVCYFAFVTQRRLQPG
ncbi:MAG: hypothetical protein MUC33_24445 [Desulfobacterales bacterium]|nr:hypothetical protein [Desulfobacterales bacterium]